MKWESIDRCLRDIADAIDYALALLLKWLLKPFSFRIVRTKHSNGWYLINFHYRLLSFVHFQDTSQNVRIVVALYPFKAIEGGDLSLEKVNIPFYGLFFQHFFPFHGWRGKIFVKTVVREMNELWWCGPEQFFLSCGCRLHRHRLYILHLLFISWLTIVDSSSTYNFSLIHVILLIAVVLVFLSDDT